VSGPIRHRRHVSAALALAVALCAAPAAPAAAQDLTLGLKVTAPVASGTVGTEVTAGIAAGAGAGYDPGLDSRAYHLGALQAWFLHPAAPERARELMRDFRGGQADDTWTLRLTTPAAPLGGEAVAAGSAITLTWGPPQTPGGVCGGRSLTLVDADGTRVDMTLTGAHTVPAPGPDGTYDLTLEIGGPGSSAAGVPAPPSRLLSPRQGRRGVLLVWSPGTGDTAGYHVERTLEPAAASPVFERLTDAPLNAPRYVDADAVGRGTVAYRVVAVSGTGCESAPSETLVVAP